MILKSKDGIGNLTFDNYNSSAKLLSLRYQQSALPELIELVKLQLSQHHKWRRVITAYDDSLSLHCVKWMDNSVVGMLSNCIGPYPLEKVERFSRKGKRMVQIPLPNLIPHYNNTMGGVDQHIAYRPVIKPKKWWWPHFTNTLGVLMGASWRIHCITNPDEGQTMLYFVRSVVQSYLHVMSICWYQLLVNGKLNHQYQMAQD